MRSHLSLRWTLALRAFVKRKCADERLLPAAAQRTWGIRTRQTLPRTASFRPPSEPQPQQRSTPQLISFPIPRAARMDSHRPRTPHNRRSGGCQVPSFPPSRHPSTLPQPTKRRRMACIRSSSEQHSATSTSRIWQSRCIRRYHRLALHSRRSRCIDVQMQWCTTRFCLPHRVSSALSVVGLDATPRAALHAPLNFFGELSAQTLSELDTTLTEIHADDPDAVTLLFSHYPASTISGGSALANLARGTPRSRFAAHLSGHLHTLHGAAPRGLQTISADGYIEAQLPDLVRRRRFRVLTVDHGILSFHDMDVATEPDSMPHIAVTNPPASLCARPAQARLPCAPHMSALSS
eukprot:IDg21990t1